MDLKKEIKLSDLVPKRRPKDEGEAVEKPAKEPRSSRFSR